ncbi:hypothetical protein [Sphingobacterium sp. 1.A.4]|uniref:hypothetical protein n=1 Tax=Sphingobacterium sp. 1.A.4 TaxID=2044603 RepID=UPI000C0C0ED7|nr:hypothetical protein [Sphingobacterium sp. 1.A.4]
MEEQGYIEIRIENFQKNLDPKDIDITDIKSIISDIETFLYPTKEDKRTRPHVSYDIEKGSAKHKFFLPISAVILFNGLTSEINKRDSIDFLDYKRQEIIDKFQRTAIKNGLTIEFNSSINQNPTLIIDNKTDFQLFIPKFFESEFYLYGEIYQEGGKKPNIHITTSEYGNLAISATKQQIVDGEKKAYKPYGVKVRGKKSLEDGKIYDLNLIEFVAYQPVFDQTLLERAIKNASKNLQKIKNLDKWIENLKTDGI